MAVLLTLFDTSTHQTSAPRNGIATPMTQLLRPNHPACFITDTVSVIQTYNIEATEYAISADTDQDTGLPVFILTSDDGTEYITVEWSDPQVWTFDCPTVALITATSSGVILTDAFGQHAEHFATLRAALAGFLPPRIEQDELAP